MNSRTIAIIAYVTIIGWIVAYILYRDNRSALAKYHLEQALGVFIFSFLWSAALQIVFTVIPFLSLLSFLFMVPLVLAIFGIIYAAQEVLKPIPFIGKFIEGKFGNL
ncbi:hypothetical protein GCM10023231_40960 [Olivibacter ginsenosidimutans]|uniref:DUF4870 domain-containing protein n=1 Tax=Olivibacter ginsenosidimutans TaxID=1176537 RepID=A0ABP9CBU1_9SPHI